MWFVLLRFRWGREKENENHNDQFNCLLGIRGHFLIGASKCILFAFSALLGSNWQIINCMHLKCALQWILIYTHTCESISTIKIMNISIILTSFLLPVCNLTHPLSVPRQPLTWFLLLLIVFYRLVLYKWNHAVDTFFRLISFIQHDYFENHRVSSVNMYLFLLC